MAANVEVLHAIVHTPQQTRQIVEEAIAIADAQERTGREWEAIFTEACHLLGARVSVVPQVQAAPFDLSQLRLAERRA